MHAKRAGNLSYNFVLIRVNNNDLGAVSDIKPPRWGIGGQIVPPAFTANWNFLDEII